ncbi:ABC transporter permease [Stieleria marina]|uniref:Aliphatic sulfonates transport permease protein SsuC n=1 Tax=Stieleria marina TaxID=1930275 RepID=A0A517NQX4_9BACT|nr:Putative aliphatic sulfonates transport permease protein SsuC [Planctomycetes bacterium K23_9]
MNRPKQLATNVLWVISVAAVGIVIWCCVIKFFGLSKILLPNPVQVATAAIEHRSELWQGTIATGLAAAIGLTFAVAIGFLIAVVFSLSRKIRMAFFPYVVFLQTVPIVAIAPLLIIWSGYRFRTVVMITVIICLFPIINNVTAGLLAVDRELSDLFRLYGAGRSKKLLRLQIPTAVPHLMVGAKTSSGLAVIGAIVAEFFIGNGQNASGLGALMQDWQAYYKTDALIAALFASMLVGLILFGGVRLIGATLLRRWMWVSGAIEKT